MGARCRYRDRMRVAMTHKGEGQQSDGGNAEVIEGFYDWGPGVVVTADCLGQSYQTALAGR
jgi:hypothetical protein